MVPRRRRAQKKVDYAANIEDRKKLAAYMNKTNFNKMVAKRSFSAGEKTLRFLISLLGFFLILTGIYFVLF